LTTVYELYLCWFTSKYSAIDQDLKDDNIAINDEDRDHANKSESKLTKDSVETQLDAKLVPSHHRNLFSRMKKDDAVDSDETSKEKKTVIHEPQVIRPTAQRNTSFFGFKNMFDDPEARGISDPKLPFMNSAITPKFLQNESDPFGLNKNFFQRDMNRNNSITENIFTRYNRNVSNNSNISQGFMYQNFEMTPKSNKSINNLSKPTEFNLGGFSALAPGSQSLAGGLLNPILDRHQAQEKEKTVQLNLVVQGNSAFTNSRQGSTQTYNLDSLSSPIKLFAEKGRKIEIEVIDESNIVIRSKDGNGEITTGNTLKSKGSDNNSDTMKFGANGLPPRPLPGIEEMYKSKF
jgi:hypothetical protein